MTKSTPKYDIKKVDDASLCIQRKKYRNGYRFYDQKGDHIIEKTLVKRLKKLIIPPMWSEVQICKWKDGHIQAIGRDLKGRKQYIYHSEWERRRQEKKFAKMYDFGKSLPGIREIALEHSHKKTWTKDKILGLLVLILDETGIRIGNKQYAERNGTYGLTTLRRKHMSMEDGNMVFEYKGKSNKSRSVEIDDDELIKLIRKSAELPGYELFRYKEGSQWETIDSDDVNAYIREHMEDKFSSKDFRTWVASRLALEIYPTAIKLKSEAPRKKFSNILLRLVADELGNTPTVCKSYYVHPTILQKIEKQNLPVCKDSSHDIFSPELSASEKLLLKELK